MPMEYITHKTHLEYRWLLESWLLPAKNGTDMHYVPVGVWYQKERQMIDAYYRMPYETMGDPQGSGGSAIAKAQEQIAKIHPDNYANGYVLHGFLLKGPPVRRTGVYVAEIVGAWPDLLLQMALGPVPDSDWRFSYVDIDPVGRWLEDYNFKPENWYEPREESDRAFKYRFRSHNYYSSGE